MVDRIVEQMVMFPFEYISPTVVTIEESSTGVAIISGTLLREGRSKNGNLYTIDEMENYADQAVGLPLYVGTMRKVDPNFGIARSNMHANIEENKVGKIIKTVFSKAERIIKFWAELVNTVKFPDIISKVKAGWGVSIGGIATKAKLMIEETGRIVTKVLGLVLSHVQLLAPDKIRGQEDAMVEHIEIQESMIFYEPVGEEVSIDKIHLKSGIGNTKIYVS